MIEPITTTPAKILKVTIKKKQKFQVHDGKIKPISISRAKDTLKKKHSAHADVKKLRALWPLLFNNQKKPLAIGIYKTLESHLKENERAIEWLPLAIRYWVGHPHYIKNLAAGGDRYNARGEPEGKITEVQQLNARERLKKIKKTTVETQS